MDKNVTERPIVAHLPSAWKPRHRDDLVRLGSRHDGGYVVTESATRNTDLLIGLGVADNWSFEKDFHERIGCAVHCYDHTVGFRQFLKRSVQHLKTVFRKPGAINIHQLFFPLKYKRFFSGKKKHFMEKAGSDPENSSDFRKIFSRAPDNDRVFIKIDIEGGEYQVLSGLREYYGRVTGLVIEFHHVIFLRDDTEKHISDLKQSFNIVHVHVNNFKGLDDRGIPDVIEVTFENKNLRHGQEKESDREHPAAGLDYPNSTRHTDYKLAFDSEILK